MPALAVIGLAGLRRRGRGWSAASAEAYYGLAVEPVRAPIGGTGYLALPGKTAPPGNIGVLGLRRAPILGRRGALGRVGGNAKFNKFRVDLMAQIMVLFYYGWWF